MYPWAASGRAQALGRTEGLTKWLVDPETERVLGCGIVGPGAGELIAEAVLAIEMGCEVRDVTESIHPHPTLSETLMNAGEVFFGTATEMYKPRSSRRGLEASLIIAGSALDVDPWQRPRLTDVPTARTSTLERRGSVPAD